LLREGVKPAFNELDVDIELYPPDRRRRDIDNTLKALLDSLQHGGAYFNDSQVKRLTITMREPVDGGSAVVKIKAMDMPIVVKRKVE